MHFHVNQKQDLKLPTSHDHGDIESCGQHPLALINMVLNPHRVASTSPWTAWWCGFWSETSCFPRTERLFLCRCIRGSEYALQQDFLRHRCDARSQIDRTKESIRPRINPRQSNATREHTSRQGADQPSRRRARVCCLRLILKLLDMQIKVSKQTDRRSCSQMTNLFYVRWIGSSRLASWWTSTVVIYNNDLEYGWSWDWEIDDNRRCNDFK
jgi:hypothetical protein